MESTSNISKFDDIMWISENYSIVKDTIRDYLISSLKIVYGDAFGHALKNRKECEINFRRFLSRIIGDTIKFSIDRFDSSIIRVYIDDCVQFDEEEMVYDLKLEYDTQMLIRLQKIKSLL